jgi:hypothetical protein
MTDVTSVLKSYLENHKTLSKENWDPSNSQTNSFICLGPHRFARNTSTRFRSRKGQGEPYTLDAICFLLLHESTPHHTYLVECSKLQCPSVSLVDKKDILDWLRGHTVNVPQLITTLLPPITSLNVNETKHDSAVATEKNDEDRATKRRKLDTPDTTTLNSVGSHVQNEHSVTASSPLSAEHTQEPLLALKSVSSVSIASQNSSNSTNIAAVASTPSSTAPINSALLQETDTSAVSALVAETGLSLEKIQALKLKRRITKRRTLSDISTVEFDDDTIEKNQTQSKLHANADAVSDTAPATVGGDVVGAHVPLIAGPLKGTSDIAKTTLVTQEIMQRERPVRTRLSVLLCRPEISPMASSSDGPFKSLLQTLQTLTKQGANKPSEQTKRYTRYEFEEGPVWKEKLKGNEAEEFQIDTRGTFASDTQLSLSLLASRKDTEPNATVTLANSGSGQPNKTSKKTPAPPIIIVPAALTSVLTLYNVKSFLNNGEYIDTQTRRNQGEKKPKSVLVTPFGKSMHASQNSVVQQYEVIDNATHLRPADWERVVAVFALGQQWQFKGWLWHEAVTLFNNVRGFYIHFDDEQVPENIKHWNVKILTINKHKRHLDRTAALEFWNEVENFIAKKKPHLRTY